MRDYDRTCPLSAKRKKRVYAQPDGKWAVSETLFDSAEGLEAFARRRQALRKAVGECSLLNVPNHLGVRFEAGRHVLVEEMPLAGATGAPDRLFPDLLEALEALHASGWVHLDVKPEQLLWLNGRWRLHDFDSAKPIGERFERREATLAYAPPDVYRFETADPSDDLYAAALVRYRQLNANRLPYGWPAEACSWPLRRLIKRVRPPRDASRDEGRLLLKALSHERSERFDSAAALRRDWQACRDMEGV